MISKFHVLFYGIGTGGPLHGQTTSNFTIMKNALFYALIAGCLTGGCKSAEKSTGKMTVDSTFCTRNSSKTEYVIAESLLYKTNLAFENLVIDIKFDSAQKITDKRYAIRNWKAGKEKSYGKAAIEAKSDSNTMTTERKSEYKFNEERKLEYEPSPWKIFSLFILIASGALVYRALRG